MRECSSYASKFELDVGKNSINDAASDIYDVIMYLATKRHSAQRMAKCAGCKAALRMQDTRVNVARAALDAALQMLR
jgi:hypothetical protein